MQARLVVVCGQQAAQQFDLPRLPVTIGRSRSTDVTLGHPLVSRQHCEVFESAGCLMIRDLGSLNGTFVGDTRITTDPVPLQPGELFSLGPVTLQADYTPPAAKPSAVMPDDDQVDRDCGAISHPTVFAPLECQDGLNYPGKLECRDHVADEPDDDKTKRRDGR